MLAVSGWGVLGATGHFGVGGTVPGVTLPSPTPVPKPQLWVSRGGGEGNRVPWGGHGAAQGLARGAGGGAKGSEARGRGGPRGQSLARRERAWFGVTAPGRLPRGLPLK